MTGFRIAVDGEQWEEILNQKIEFNVVKIGCDSSPYENSYPSANTDDEKNVMRPSYSVHSFDGSRDFPALDIFLDLVPMNENLSPLRLVFAHGRGFSVKIENKL